MESDDTATPADTRELMLRYTGRRYTVVRHILRQLPSNVAHRTSVLGPMVTDRKRRSLVLYLLLLTCWPWLESTDGEPLLPAASWARGLRTVKGRSWNPSLISQAWVDLEERQLITKVRRPHGLIVKPRREDGAADYTAPGSVADDFYETYFVLPGEFWTEEWFERLSLPALAMLLIIAGETSEKQEVRLTNKDTAKWFGMSARSVESGIKDLMDSGLLSERLVRVKAPLSASGQSTEHWYNLTGAFSTDARRTAQERAQVERERRSEGLEGTTPQPTSGLRRRRPRGSKQAPGGGTP